MGFWKNIDTNELADAIAECMSNYSNDITEGIKMAVDIVSKETDNEIKNHINFKERSGKYVKAFRIKKAYEDGYKKVNNWYVGNGQHRLTHLLEKGHALRQGGRTRAFPHIKYGEELAIKRMEELSKLVIENANKR